MPDPELRHAIAFEAAPKLRHAIAFEAARLMYDRDESEYLTAKRKAAARVCRGSVKPSDLPSNAEVRDIIQTFARLHEGDRRTADLRAMRLAALRHMRNLARFRPRLIGSVLTGHVRRGSDIDIHVFSDHVGPVTEAVEADGLQYDVERKAVRKHGGDRVFTHVHVYDTFPVERTVYAEGMAHHVFTSSVTGRPIERATARELELLVAREYPDLDIDGELAARDARVDPLHLFRLLLLPLDRVRQDPRWHPEGDVLFHSLQVFERAKDARPFDEEFLTAALLHDVGKGIDPHAHVAAGVRAVDGLVTDRTLWLIAHHMQAVDYRAGALGDRQRRKLAAHPDFDELMLLRDCDDRGRLPGAAVGTVDDALGYLLDLGRMTGERGA